ncbi:DUF465 domain-containing protein [Halodesulfovibrio marinisediminis]|uniref:DUF465 domain-containing protein n=1 Tax=Halodesulfovibrio marinisediminis DSM 17456 TaxID=1121457 RepID=A0A1N6DU77_9BACT|nr:DUF465 domain-containing protein [Halodesulfovibrio marinisediminis]SIN74346.1 hypothetical protein SAMN02745161_0488 [Halodesulfovibrio marinisediminis DSM 17456]
MEVRDVELLEKHLPHDETLKALWDEHILFEKQVDKLESKKLLTPQEEVSLRELKKQKLDGKTKIQIMLDRYRELEM